MLLKFNFIIFLIFFYDQKIQNSSASITISHSIGPNEVKISDTGTNRFKQLKHKDLIFFYLIHDDQNIEMFYFNTTNDCLELKEFSGEEDHRRFFKKSNLTIEVDESECVEQPSNKFPNIVRDYGADQCQNLQNHIFNFIKHKTIRYIQYGIDVLLNRSVEDKIFSMDANDENSSLVINHTLNFVNQKYVVYKLCNTTSRENSATIYVPAFVKIEYECNGQIYFQNFTLLGIFSSHF